MTLEYDQDFLQGGSTGSHGLSEDYQIIIRPLGKYAVKVKLTPEGKFIDVIEVKINADFLSYRQKIASLDSLDVEDFYRED